MSRRVNFVDTNIDYKDFHKPRKKEKVPTKFLDNRKKILTNEKDSVQELSEDEINWKVKLQSGFFEARAIQTLKNTKNKIWQEVDDYENESEDDEDYIQSLRDAGSNVEYEIDYYTNKVNQNSLEYQKQADQWLNLKESEPQWKDIEKKRLLEEQRIINDLIMNDDFIDENFFTRNYIYDDAEDQYTKSYNKYKAIENDLTKFKIRDAEPEMMFSALRDMIYKVPEFEEKMEEDFDFYTFDDFTGLIEDSIEFNNCEFTEEDEDGIIRMKIKDKEVTYSEQATKQITRFYDDKDFLDRISKMLRIDVDRNLIVSWSVEAICNKYTFVYIPSGGGKTNLFNRFRKETLDIDYLMKKIVGIDINNGLKMLMDEYIDTIAYQKWNELWRLNVDRQKHLFENKILLCHSPSQVPNHLKQYKNGLSTNQLILLPTKLNNVRKFKDNYHYLRSLKFDDDKKIAKYQVHHDFYFNIICKFFNIKEVFIKKKFDYYDVLKFRKRNIYGNLDMNRNYDSSSYDKLDKS